LKPYYYNLLNDSFTKVTGVEREIDCIIEEDITKTVENTVEQVVNNDEVINNNEEHFDSNLNPSLNFENFVVGICSC